MFNIPYKYPASPNEWCGILFVSDRERTEIGREVSMIAG
jgi:hypothetical protein